MTSIDEIMTLLSGFSERVDNVQTNLSGKGEIFATVNEIPVADSDGNLISSKLKQVSTGVSVTGDIIIQSSGKIAVGSSSNYGYGTTGQVLTSNSTTNSPSWETMAFTKLSDAPGDLGEFGKTIQVNIAGDALEFVDVPDRVSTAITNAIDGLIDSAPETLNTLKEIATALNDDANVATNLTNLINTKQDQITASSTLDASLVGDGSVDNTELSYLDGVTSNIQTQINSKQDEITAASRLNANLVGDGSVDNTKLSHLNTVTSNIQTQINSKQDEITAASRLNANLVGDGSVDNTKLSYLHGVTNNIQTQIDSKEDTLAPDEKIPWNTDQSANYKIHANNLPLQSGGGLSISNNNELRLAEESFTITEKNKLFGIDAGAQVNVQSDWNATTGDAFILNKPSLVTDFTDLLDTPGIFGSTGQILQVDSNGTKLEFVTPSFGASAFTGLSDTPTTFGPTGAILQVDSNGTALEFATSVSFNDVDVNGTLTINDITPTTSSTSSSVPDGTTTLSQTLTSTNQRYFGRTVRITSNSEYIFATEDVASGNGPNIYVYKKVSGSYSTTPWQTITTGRNSQANNTRIDIKPDGSLLAVAQVDPFVNANRVYFYLYYFNSSTGYWTASNSNPYYKTWNYNMSGGLSRVHTFMSTLGNYMAIGNGVDYVSGGSAGDGTVTVFKISGSGSSLSVSQAVEFTHQNNSNLRFGELSFVNIADNGYLIAAGQVWNGSYMEGTIYLYKIDFTTNPATPTFKFSLTNPSSLTTSAADDSFATMPVIDENYFAFCAYAQDNPESATAYNTGGYNVGAIFVYDYNNTGTDTAPKLIKDVSTTNDYSFFGGPTTEYGYAMGQTNITIKVINSKMFIYAGAGFGRTHNQNNNGLVGIFTYDLSNGTDTSTWNNTETILGPVPNLSYPYNFGFSCGVSDDSFIISAPGVQSANQPATQIIQVRTLDTITTTNSTYSTINGTIGLNGGLALGSNADTGTAGQVLVSGGPSGSVSWSNLERTTAKATNTTGSGSQTIPHNTLYPVDFTMHNGNVNYWNGTSYIFKNTGDFKITFIADINGVSAFDIIITNYAYVYKNYGTTNQVELYYYRVQTGGETYISLPISFSIVESFLANDTLTIVLRVATTTSQTTYTIPNGTILTITQLV